MSTKLKVLQIGAGSMGTRRLRDLAARGDVELALLDQRADRRARAAERFGIATFDQLESALAWGPAALSISTPPDVHEPFIRLALDRGLHSFCEANIWTYAPAEVERASSAQRLVTAASCSMRFLPSVRKLTELAKSKLGSLIHYHMTLAFSGAGWHADEGREYYGRHPSTAPAREMIAFEAEYLNDVFGAPVSVAGSVTGRGNDAYHPFDTWIAHARLANGATGTFCSSMASPVSVRVGEAVGLGGRLSWDIMTGDVRFIPAGASVPQEFATGRIGDVLEAAYYEEISTFIDAIRGTATWPFSYRDNAACTALIAAIERSQINGQWETVDGQPAKVFEIK